MYRLLRVLAAAGILEEQPGRLFRLTGLGRGLRSDVPESLAGWVRFVGRPYEWAAWTRLPEAVRTGGHAFLIEHGADVWTYRGARPDEAVIFNRAMNSASGRMAEHVVAAHDFSRYRVVVDVGGGGGRLIAAILARNPDTRGILFDVPHIVAESRPYIEASGLAGRCELIGGSFFESASIPRGGDAYVLKSIIHDWHDDDSLKILAACRAAMETSARLLLVERLIAGPNEGLEAKLSDLNMFVTAGGQERAADEFRELLNRASFQMLNIVPAGVTNVIEAAPA